MRCCMAALSALDYEHLMGKLSFVPLLASFALSGAADSLSAAARAPATPR